MSLVEKVKAMQADIKTPPEPLREAERLADLYGDVRPEPTRYSHDNLFRIPIACGKFRTEQNA